MNDPQLKEPSGDILVVEDNLPSLRVLSNLLIEDGYQVRSARDGSTALMLATADPPELICLDVNMPGMNGFEVCRQLKSNPQTCDVPVIFISGLDEVVDKLQGFKTGGVDYITKPFNINEVGIRVKTHLALYQLRRELDRRVKELSAVNRVAQVVATTADLQDSLAKATGIVADLFHARAAFVTVPERGDSKLHILAGFERTSNSLSTASQILPLTEMSITRQVLGSGKTRSLPKVKDLSLPDPVQTFIDNFDFHLLLLVPLKVRGEVIGVLVLGLDEPDRSFTDEEISLAETIASEIASAIENARLIEEDRLAAVDTERQRLARELHDSVTQSLYSLILLSSGWRNMARQGTLEDPVDSFEQLIDVAQQGLKEMRLLIHQLRPSEVEEMGLVQALQQRLDIVECRANVEAQLLTQGDVESLANAVEDQLFHIAQEALNNSLRHAHASEVIVQIIVDDHCVDLSIKDDGEGFDPSTDTAGMGLTTMRERAVSMKGEVTITSEPGDGTTVNISIPLEADENG